MSLMKRSVSSHYNKKNNWFCHIFHIARKQNENTSESNLAASSFRDIFRHNSQQAGFISLKPDALASFFLIVGLLSIVLTFASINHFREKERSPSLAPDTAKSSILPLSTPSADIGSFGELIISGDAEIAGDLFIKGEKITIPTFTAGDAISLDGINDITISNNGVASLQNQTGNLALTAGNGITIDGLTITNNAPNAIQNTFESIKVTNNEIDSTFGASKSNDILTFVAGGNINIASDTTNKKLTISSTSPSEATGWQLSGSTVSLLNNSYNVGIGTTSPNTKLHVYQGTSNNNGQLQVGGTASIGLQLSYENVGSGRSVLSDLNNTGGSNNYITLGFGAVTSGIPVNTVATFNQSGQVAIPTTGSSAGLLLGGDTQLFRGDTNRLDLATGDSINIVNGNVLLPTNFSKVGADTSINYLTFGYTAGEFDINASGQRARINLDTDNDSTTTGFQIYTNAANGTGTLLFHFDEAGYFSVSTNGTAGGIWPGTDVQMYRSATNTLALASGDSFNIVSGNLTVASANATGTTTSSGLSLSANSVTSGTAAYISATGLTTGKILDIVGTASPTDGSENYGLKLAITHSPTASADTYNGYYSNITDATALGNTIRSISSNITLSGNAAKTARLYEAYFSDTSTTGDTITGILLGGGASGALSAGQNRYLRGIQLTTNSTAATANADSTTTIWGADIQPSSTLATTGTNTMYGVYTKTTATHAADAGTINNFGVYIANGTSSTNGTSSKYGLYIEAPTGADNNFGAQIGGQVAIGGNANAGYGVYVTNDFSYGAGELHGLRVGDMNLTASGGTSSLNISSFGINSSLVVTSGNTHAFASNAYFSMPTITETSGAVTNAVNVFIEGGPTAGDNNYAFWVDAGTSRLDGQLQLPTTGSAAGLLFGGDTNLYHSAANVLKTDDSLTIGGGTITLDVDTNVVLTGGINGISFDTNTLSVDATNNYVGIGTTTPSTNLGIAGSGARISLGDDQSIKAQVYRAGTVFNGPTEYSMTAFNGAIAGGTFVTENTTGLCWDNSSDSMISDCNGAPTDLAELYGTSDASIEAADIVISAGEAQEILDPSEGKHTSRAFVAKSTAPYQGALLGVISTNPNQVYGEDGVFTESDNPRPVSLAGRVPVKVTTENGPIQTGDAITSSSIPGVGMRATKSGRIVGTALGSYSGEGIGSVIIFVNPSYFLGTAIAQSVSDDPLFSLLDSVGILNTQYQGQILSSNQVQKLINEQATVLGISTEQTSSVSAQLASLTEVVGALEANLIAQEIAIASISATLANLPVINLTQFATGSAVLGITIVEEDFAVSGNTTLSNLSTIGDITIANNLTLASTSINTIGEDLQIQPLKQGNVSFMDGLVMIDIEGNVVVSGKITAPTIETSKLIITTTPTSQAIGSGTIVAGETEIVIETTAVTADSKILLSPTTQLGSKSLYVSSKTADTSFTVSLDGTIMQSNITFDWFILEAKSN